MSLKNSWTFYVMAKWPNGNRPLSTLASFCFSFYIRITLGEPLVALISLALICFSLKFLVALTNQIYVLSCFTNQMLSFGEPNASFESSVLAQCQVFGIHGKRFSL